MCQLNFVTAMCFKGTSLESLLLPKQHSPAVRAAWMDPAMAQFPAWGHHWPRVPLHCLFSSLCGWKGGSHPVHSLPHVTGSPGRAAQPYGDVGSVEHPFHWGWGQLDGAPGPGSCSQARAQLSQIMSAQPTCISSCFALREKRFL